MHRFGRVFGVIAAVIVWTTTGFGQDTADFADDSDISWGLADAVEAQPKDKSVRLTSHASCGEEVEPTCAEPCEPSCDVNCESCTAGCEGCATCGAPQMAFCTCQPCRDPWYVSVSGAWQQRETVHEVDDPQTFIKFHSGFLANAALGMRFEMFRLEIEASFMNNEVDLAGAGGLSSPSPGNVSLRAYMFNVYHDVQFKDCCWKPYVGAGIGTYQSELNGLIPEFFDTLGPPFAGNPVNATSDMPLAYQFRAGVSRQIGCRSEFFTGYRFFKGEELEFASAPFATFAPTFHPDGAEIHAVELGVRVNF
jgi:opacity protein-like surface antigen